jgi:hypothetical protein
MIPHQNCEAKDTNSLYMSPQPGPSNIYLITHNSLKTGRRGEETKGQNTGHDTYASSASLIISAFSGTDIVRVTPRPNSCTMNRRANGAADLNEKKRVGRGPESQINEM